MSKRFYNPQQYGERKKPRLDVSRTDHNFPLSQNRDVHHDDNWGDDNDDEILLMASQACEQAYTNDVSQLPDYSMCMQPGLTSTQVDSGPGQSKGAFQFKKPTTSVSNAVPPPTFNDNKCNRISSPLPGMSKVVNGQLNGDRFNDKIYKNQDPEYIFRQLLQLQEENAKLKSENGKLQEKCVTKEGEASILRTQLKTCQVAVDNVRMEKIKAQEKVQMEWTDKLSTANNQMRDLRNQLDFKNLEIISVKERCRMLESSKVKLTQVTLGPNDFANSSRLNNSFQASNESIKARRVKTTTSGVQTENKTHFIKLNKTCRKPSSKLKGILPIIHQPTADQISLLDFNEKLQTRTDFTQNRCRIFSTFHKVPKPIMEEKINKLNINSVYEDVTCLATCEGGDLKDKYYNVLKHVKTALNEVLIELETISARSSAAFQREMDELYIEAAGRCTPLPRDQLISGRCLFKEEQAILPRRIVAILGYILESTPNTDYLKTMLDCDTRNNASVNINLKESISRICSLLESTSCAVLYSGFLQALAILLEITSKFTTTLNSKILEISKTIIISRPMPTVSCYLVRVLRYTAATEMIMEKLCVKNTTGNMKVDYDQGVLLFKKETCHLQVLLKQIEASLKCTEKEAMTAQAVDTAGDLLSFYAHINKDMSCHEKYRCDCQLVMGQVLVYALQICAVMMKKGDTDTEMQSRLEAVCSLGAGALYLGSLAEAPGGWGGGGGGGRRLVLLEGLQGWRGAGQRAAWEGTMLSELLSSMQPTTEGLEPPADLQHQVWTDSFSRFTIAD